MAKNSTWQSFRKWNRRRRARRQVIRAHYHRNYDARTELARTGVLAMSARL